MSLIIDPSNDTLFYDSVRRLLGGVDKDILPDEDISDPAILDVAELQVIGLISNFDLTLASIADKTKIRLATIHIMASLLCPSMPNRIDIEVKTIDLNWKRKAIDYEELAQKLMDTALSLLDNLEGFEVGGESIIFAIAPSKRAVNHKHEEK
ncbi:hypothetical protein [Brevibacillus laterosporus]|uniref:hypothetical protein n=1 Tax=Brevibacillus laterosporus TaxID=1465 RepID=UPI003D1A9CF1